jgi:lauroyl/myristoyl acyltransferase
MSLSRFLQSPDILAQARSSSPSDFKTLLINRGLEWFSSQREERKKIKRNLDELGIDYDESIINNIQYNIILHYYEKLLGLCGTVDSFSRYLSETVDARKAVATIQNVRNQGAGVLLAASHFGAVELIGPTLALQKIPVTSVLRFTTEQLSTTIHRRADELMQSGKFGSIGFIEIGKKGTAVALEMAAALRRSEALLAVFDEHTEYSTTVNLFGQNVRGGAGLDKIISFSGTQLSVFTAFMIRTGKDMYRLELREVNTGEENPVQQMYDHLQAVLSAHLEQWYFLHESIPFAAPSPVS